jgi:hypothetical protein
MRSRDSRAARNPVRRTARANRVAGKIAFLLLFVALATTALLVGLRPAGAQLRKVTVQGRATAAPQAPQITPSQPSTLQPASVTTVNFKQLAVQQAQQALRSSGVKQATVLRAIHPPMSIDDTLGGTTSTVPGGDEVSAPVPPVQNDPGGPDVASPSPSQSFLAQEDGPRVGTSVFTIPPDTMGAVGLDKVFTNVNNNYRVHNKATGAALSTVSIETFWASTGATGLFDPRTLYDPYNNRWILSAVSNAQTANSSVLIGISNTSDAQGTYTLFRFIVGCAAGAAGCNAGGEWADFPMLGFNKNWVAVTWNQFVTTTGANVAARGILLDYPALRAGTNNSYGFSITGAFCFHPATTFSPTEPVLYFAEHLSSGGATYFVGTVTGPPPGAPTISLGATKTRPGGGWTQAGGDSLPQQCVPGVGLPTQTCPATLRRIDAGDSQVRSNVVFRNGKLYYPQTISLPAGTASTADASHYATQWTVLDAATGNFVDGGRVEDATATKINGGKHYAYSSISVNKNNDVLFGFSQFASNQYASAGYTFRLGTDAAGTMRDPNIYKAGEDYYNKTFGGTRNRWGDYSHTVIDPSNDHDLWTIEEYAQLRTGTTGEGSNDPRWGTYWAKVVAGAGGNDLLISEFRLHGPNGANDEFIEIYNNNDTPLTVSTIDGSAGYAVVSASAAALNDGTPTVRCTIPTGTVIPGRGHYLCTNSVGYSLGSYPAGTPSTATGDATYATDIPFNDGLAIFNTANPANFSTTTRLDAVGSSSVTNTLYREGAGYAPLTGGASAAVEHSLIRDLCGKQGSTTQLGGCPTLGFPRDTNNNAVDFYFADTNGTPTGGQQRLGAPGPENLSSPVQRNDTLPGASLDATVGTGAAPNRVRDFTSDPANNSTFGTLDIRKRIHNTTGSPVTRLRFRIIDITTFPVPGGYADMRARTSTAVVVSGVNDPQTCPGGVTPCTVTVQGTTLETPPSQPNGGGFNSSLSADTVTLATPIAPGASINVRFLLGLQGTGTFKFFVNVEALP